MRLHFALVLGALTLAIAPAANAQSIGTLTDGLNTFVSNATGSLPFASAAGLDWSDAYIGSIVGVPPHFGFGLVTGATTIPGKTINPLITALGGSSSLGDVPIPLLAVNGRIGGFILPFDVGLKISIVPPLSLNGYDVTYQNYGFDVRYAVFEGEPLLPDVSVGAGVDYFAAGLGAKYGSNVNYTYQGNTLSATAPQVKLDLSSVTFEAKAQVSKSLIILTPYLGLSALVGSSTAKATVTSTITTPGQTLAYWQQLVPGLTAAGFGKDNSSAGFGLKLFGGTSVNLFVFKLDLQGMYSILDGSYGGTLGARFQL